MAPRDARRQDALATDTASLPRDAFALLGMVRAVGPHDSAESVPLGPDGNQAGRRSRETGDVQEDEGKLAELIAALPDPVNMMLALANRTGLRLGEVCGLRLSDLDTIPKGFLTVSHSYANPLKEDRHGNGKVKKAPAPVDVAEALKMHVARRRLQGAGPDDLLFVPTKTSKRPRANDWRGFKKENIRDLWWAACGQEGASSWTTRASRP